MTPLELALVVAVAALLYQEICWRDRTRRLEADYQRRLSTEKALSYAGTSAEEPGPVRSFTFYSERIEPSGLFREVTRPLFLAVTMSGDTVLHAAGDLAEISRFDLPPAIRASLSEFLAPEAPRTAAMSVR